MEPSLERLIRLQEISLAIEDRAKKLATMPGRKLDQEQSLARHRAAVAKSRDELGGLQKERRKLEGDLAAVEARISKYQDQLMDVKTNKEYQAMLAEIGTVKEEREGLETRILQAMETADILDADIRAHEAALAEEQTRVSAALTALSGEEEHVAAEKVRLEEERKRLEGEIPADLVAEFSRIAKNRDGLAVVRVKDGMCQGCSVRIQPRIYQQARHNEALLRCDSCRRFLYYIEEKRDEPPPPP